MEDVVIGSGPAGVTTAWALVEQGRDVTLFDVGEELEPEKSELRDRLAASPHENWSAADIGAYTGIRQSGRDDRIFPFGSDFPFRDRVGFSAETEISAGPVGIQPSFAAGGLSNGWGAAILPFRQEDLLDWPVSARDLAPHYQALRALLPMSGCTDDLQQLFPALDVSTDTPLPLSSQAKNLLLRMQRRRQRLQVHGVHFGQARQAVSGDCRKCGMCLYGCPYGVIFNARHTLDQLLAAPNFTYVPRRYVTRLQERTDGVRLWARNLADGRELELGARRVFVAGGVLSTTRLLLHSLAAYDRPVAMKDSQHFFLPMLHAWRTSRRPDREERHSLVQLFMELLDPETGMTRSHVQIYTYNDLFASDMEQRFGSLGRPLRPLARRLARRLIVAQAFLHSDDSCVIELRLSRDGDRQVLRLLPRANDSTPAAIRDARRRLARTAAATGLLPLLPFLRPGEPGSSFHCGSTFPMKDQPDGLESDRLGRPAGLRRIHAVDASVLPSIPPTTITLTVMANAHRIATQAGRPSLATIGQVRQAARRRQ